VLLSQTGRYALRATLHIGQLEPGQRATADEIAAALDVPRNYLSKILHLLAQAGVLESTRGPGGGFKLALPPAELPLSRILEPVEPGLGTDRGCLLGRSECSNRNPCAVHDEWRGIADRIDAFLNDNTLGSLAQQKRSAHRSRRVRRPPTTIRKTKGGSR
jgi:Rrf2 family iron-sulfur cluster assembly transcriptional regulator